MGILPDVELSIRDGGLGVVPAGVDILGAVGVGAVSQSSPVILSSWDDVKSKVGEGPLRDFLEGVYSAVQITTVASVLPATIAGSLSVVDVGADNAGHGAVAAAGDPFNAFSLRVDIVNSGGLNSATFVISKNGIRGGEVTVPADGVYAIPDTGVTLTFSEGSPAGSEAAFEANDTYALSTSAPTTDVQSLLDGVEALKTQPVNYRHIAVAGTTNATFWAGFDLQIKSFAADKRWTWGSVAARGPADGETTDDYVTAMLGAERGTVESIELMICQGMVSGTDLEGFEYVRNFHGKLIGRIFNIGVATSPGWTALGNLPAVSSIVPGDLSEGQIALLKESGYAVARYYNGYRGVYVEDSTLASPAGSDYDTSVRIEVMVKARLGIRAKQWPFLKRGFDVLPDGRVPELAQVEAAGQQFLDQMVKDKEISSGRIVLPQDQDILATKVITEEIYIIPLGQVNEIRGIIQYENPNAGGV